MGAIGANAFHRSSRERQPATIAEAGLEDADLAASRAAALGAEVLTLARPPVPFALATPRTACLLLGGAQAARPPRSRGRAALAAIPDEQGKPASGEDLRTQIGVSAVRLIDGFARGLTDRREQKENDDRTVVDRSLKRLERDVNVLDATVSGAPQLSEFESFLLPATVLVAFASPFILTSSVVEVLVPSMAALSASVGFSAEYLGKVAVSRGKEIAAATLQASAEAEMLLAQSERQKAIIPFCVGIAATASALALVAPNLLTELASRKIIAGAQVFTEIYLVCPIFAVLAAAVAALAADEAVTLGANACGVGKRRFASADGVGRTWMSATEQITSSVERTEEKWRTFAIGVLPAPLLAVLIPGDLAFRAIVAASVAAAQAAYSLARAEYAVAIAIDAVAVKSRAAAVSDTYANQGARSGGILPFTSALSGLCAATTVAVVEVLPLIGSPLGEAFVCVSFPLFGALIAAAASISKARCVVDADAATYAATQLAGERGKQPADPIRATIELVYLTIKSTGRELKQLVRRPGSYFKKIIALLRKVFGLDGPESTPAPA